MDTSTSPTVAPEERATLNAAHALSEIIEQAFAKHAPPPTGEQVQKALDFIFSLTVEERERYMQAHANALEWAEKEARAALGAQAKENAARDIRRSRKSKELAETLRGCEDRISGLFRSTDSRELIVEYAHDLLGVWLSTPSTTPRSEEERKARAELWSIVDREFARRRIAAEKRANYPSTHSTKTQLSKARSKVKKQLATVEKARAKVETIKSRPDSHPYDAQLAERDLGRSEEALQRNQAKVQALEEELKGSANGPQ